MDIRSTNILENNRAMMALVGEKACLGVRELRSSIYNQDPRYEGGKGQPGCGLQNFYIPTGNILGCMKRKPNMNLYNMPKKGGQSNIRIVNNDRQLNNEVSCFGRNGQNYRNTTDIGSMYPHRNRATLHSNLKEVGCFKCEHEFSKSSTCFKCMDCGCRYSERERTDSEMNRNGNSQCNFSGPINPVVVQVSCVPESKTSNGINGRTTYLFRFNIQQQPDCCNNENEEGLNSKDFSSSVWWTCNLSDCQCQNKNDTTTYEGCTGNEKICTIPGKNGRPVPVTCHYCFNLNDNNADACRFFSNSNKCSKTRNTTQKSLHGGSCICTMCERLRRDTRKRPNYYFQLNKAKSNNTMCAGDEPSRQTGPSPNGHYRHNPDHGPLCGCTDHQKCLNSQSSLNSQYGINCFTKGRGSNGNLHSINTDTENKCLCLCHNVAPDNWQLDFENKQSCEGDGLNQCAAVSPPVLVRKCV